MSDPSQDDGKAAIANLVSSAEVVPPPQAEKPSGNDGEQKRVYRRKGTHCPVKPLGAVDGVFYYLTARGEVRSLSGGKHSKLELTGLFGAECGYLWDEWPRFDKKGEEVVGWNPQAVAEWLMGKADAAGFFNLEKTVRGAGVWASNDGQLIIHCGDKVLVPTDIGRQIKDAKPLKEDIGALYSVYSSGCMIEGRIYHAQPGEKPPELKRPAPASVAQELLQHLQSWNWRAKQSGPYLWLGFLGAAIVGGALRWRPHINVAGDSGTGKTELEKLITGIFSHDGILHASDPSAAGIRQLLKGSARPVILDEVEPSPDNRRASDIQELARLASSDGQGAVARGGSDGKAQTWPIRGNFYFSSILYPTPKPQDRTRITFLDLDQLKSSGAAQDASHRVRERTKYFTAHGPALRARMILGWERYHINLDVYRGVFASLYAGLATANRAVDQIATLFACAETLLYDEPTNGSAAADFISELGFDQIAVVEADHDHDECLNTLLASSPDLWRSGRRLTIGELIKSTTKSDFDGNEKRDALRSIGLSVYPNKENWTELRIANRHVGLNTLFGNTRWAGGVWSQALKRLHGATSPNKAASFGGAKAKYIALPRSIICDDGDDEPSTPPDEYSVPI